MDTRALISLELDGMRQALEDARHRLSKLQAEVEQLQGAVTFAEYILEQTADKAVDEEAGNGSNGAE